MFRKTIWSAGAVLSIWKKVPLSTENGIDRLPFWPGLRHCWSGNRRFFRFLGRDTWRDGVVGGNRFSICFRSALWFGRIWLRLTCLLDGNNDDETACSIWCGSRRRRLRCSSGRDGRNPGSHDPWHRMPLLSEPEYPGHLRRVISRWRCGWKLEYSHASPAECAIWRRIWLNGTAPKERLTGTGLLLMNPVHIQRVKIQS